VNGSQSGNLPGTRPSRLTVLAGPTAVGKGSVSADIRAHHPEVWISVSATTRAPRPGEENGVHYWFVSPAEFDRMVAEDELLEWAVVHQAARYGTPRKPVEQALKQGRDVLFDIDWQGTQQLREKMPRDLVSVFVLPPSIPELERRLHTRAQDDERVIRDRMAKASGEMTHWAEYDYVIINRDLDRAFDEVRAILYAERVKRERQTGLTAFVRGLQKKL
jgi:guanylate kinase